MNITKLELCNRVSKKFELQGKNISANNLEKIFESFMEEILTVMAEGKNLELRGFGSFKIKTRKERIGRNPRTGQLVNIPSYKAPTFKFSKDGQRIFDEKSKEINQPIKTEKIIKKVYTAKESNLTIIPAKPEKIDISALKTAENFRV